MKRTVPAVVQRGLCCVGVGGGGVTDAIAMMADVKIPRTRRGNGEDNDGCCRGTYGPSRREPLFHTMYHGLRLLVSCRSRKNHIGTNPPVRLPAPIIQKPTDAARRTKGSPLVFEAVPPALPALTGWLASPNACYSCHAAATCSMGSNRGSVALNWVPH